MSAGNRALSTTSTLKPFRARSSAVEAPATLPPTTITSNMNTSSQAFALSLLHRHPAAAGGPCPVQNVPARRTVPAGRVYNLTVLIDGNPQVSLSLNRWLVPGCRHPVVESTEHLHGIRVSGDLC